MKARGLLDDTLVIWTGEFGRTPFDQSMGGARTDAGRDHNSNCWTMFMAGAGVKQGLVHGTPQSCTCSASTMSASLTYRYSGRDFRLTDVHGMVVRQILS